MKKSAQTQQFDPVRSNILSLLILAVHGFALLAAWSNGLSPSIKGMIAVAVLLHLPFSLRKHIFVPPHRRRWLLFSETKGWRLQVGAGVSCSVRLLPSSVVTPWVTVLHFQDLTGNGRENIVVWRDSLEPEDYRRLRVAVKIPPGPTGAR